MKNEFQSLAMGLFAQNEITDAKFIVGGKATTAPNGGCTCDTPGGTRTLGAGTQYETSYTYSSDTQAYNADGSNGEKDFQGK